LNGTLLGVCTEKEKKVPNQFKVLDPRANEVVVTVDCHTGNKKPKMTFLGNNKNYIATIGTGRRKRELSLWDLRQPEKRVQNIQMQGSAQAYLDFVEDNDLIFTTSKGETGINIYEFQAGSLMYANRYADNKGSMSTSLCPRRCVNYDNQEIARFLRLGGDSLECISFR
jgi:hypothetical protein